MYGLGPDPRPYNTVCSDRIRDEGPGSLVVPFGSGLDGTSQVWSRTLSTRHCPDGSQGTPSSLSLAEQRTPIGVEEG